MLVAALAVIAASLNAGLPEPIAGTAAAGYVPAPSSRTLLVDETSRLVTTVEWSHAAGLAGVIQGPAAFSNLAMSIEEVSSMSWVRSVLTEIGPNGKVSGRIYRLYGLTDRGLELFVEASDTAGLSYKPGLVVLPADVRAGSDWRSEGGIFLFQGDSRPIDGHYTYTGTATAADGDCLAVHAVLNLGQGPGRTGHNAGAPAAGSPPSTRRRSIPWRHPASPTGQIRAGTYDSPAGRGHGPPRTPGNSGRPRTKSVGPSVRIRAPAPCRPVPTRTRSYTRILL